MLRATNDQFLQKFALELEIKDTTDKASSASYIDLPLKLTKLYGKRDSFNFPIVNFAFICNNISAAPAYGVYISQLIDIPELVVPITISLIESCC